MASNKYKKRRIGFVILLLLLLLIAVGVITVTGEINGGKKTGETVTVSIAQGSGTSAIAQELKDAGLIGNTTLFKLYSRTHGGDGRYQYGDFTLEKGSSYQELIDALCSTVSYRETVTLTLPEGWNSFQMARAAAAAGLCTEEEYLAAANATDYDFDWMKDISTDENKLTILEGFLYPETYSFYTDATARDIVTTQLREFEKKVLTEENKAALADSGFTLEEWVIFASIVQKESASVEEMYNVSSVFHNRLSNASEYPMLQSCTTNNFIWDYVEPIRSRRRCWMPTIPTGATGCRSAPSPMRAPMPLMPRCTPTIPPIISLSPMWNTPTTTPSPISSTLPISKRRRPLMSGTALTGW